MAASLFAALRGRAAKLQAAVRDVDGILERYLPPSQITTLARETGFDRVIHRSVGIGLSPKPYYLAEKRGWPLRVLRVYGAVASRAERVAVCGGWLPWGKIQRVTCIK